mgnify:CR=1 FL=1
MTRLYDYINEGDAGYADKPAKAGRRHKRHRSIPVSSSSAQINIIPIEERIKEQRPICDGLYPQDWGLTIQSPDVWQSTVYEVSDYGGLRMIINYGKQVVKTTVIMEDDEFQEIKDILSGGLTDEEVFACYGDAWSFTTYGEHGRVVQKKPMGYIYGIQSLECIAEIFETYSRDFE